ncbi:MAG: CoA transferase, partial [Bacteroidia bacterium]|nr:CoA transferase [Bacteroidia bacterium]
MILPCDAVPKTFVPLTEEFFKDIIVLELASVLAGPSVGQFFAELGATVVKVENLTTGGDVTRTWKLANERTDDRSAYFTSVNWGKRAVAVNLQTLEGRHIVHQLVRKSDIVIASFKPGDDAKLGVDYATLAALNPRIVYGRITGYGPGSERVGYDAVLQAEAGFMFMNGEPGGRSLKMPVALIDVLAGHQLKEAILLAMLQREKTGEGAPVEVSLFQTAVSSLVNQAANYLVANIIPAKTGSTHPNIAPYGDTFLTADNKEIILAVGTDRQFRQLCVVLEMPEVADNQEFATNQNRVANRRHLHQLLSGAIRRHPATGILEALQQASGTRQARVRAI